MIKTLIKTLIFKKLFFDELMLMGQVTNLTFYIGIAELMTTTMSCDIIK